MENILFELEHTVDDQSVRYKLLYLRGRRIYGRARNKTFPLVTQCLVFKNGLLIGNDKIVKCDNDLHNTEFALKLLTKKIIKNIYSKDDRKEIWKKLKLKIQNGVFKN